MIKKAITILDALFSAAAASLCWTLSPVRAGVEPQVGTLTEVSATILLYSWPRSKYCGKHAEGVTASGHRIKSGDKFIAADPNIPFGTKFIVQGYNDDKPVPVLDRNVAIRGNHIAVFFDSHKQALEWDCRWLPVIRFDPPKRERKLKQIKDD